MASLDWSGAIGIAAGLVGVFVAVVQARQKGRIDELTAAQAVIKLKQEEVDGWIKKYNEKELEAARLLAENGVLTKLFRWESIPDPLQHAFDKLEKLVETMLNAMTILEKLVKSETGRLEDDKR